MHCVALISGGLDSHLAIRILQQQGVAVTALHFQSLFAGGSDHSRDVARQTGVPLTTLPLDRDYLDIVRQPRFGYGRGANPCVDCRIYMFTRARQFMEQIGARFVISGEVLGQRPGSQKRRDLDAIRHHSGLGDTLLRPLSAKLLAPTLPEQAGWVDRERLFGFFGRGRRGLIQLATSLGIAPIPTPSTGCVLSEPPLARKVFDLVRTSPRYQMWDFQLLRYGRHYRVDDRCKIVLGRREAENRELERLHSAPDAGKSVLLAPEGFAAPTALVAGDASEEAISLACRLVQRFAREPDRLTGRLRVQRGVEVHYRDPLPVDAETRAWKDIANA